MVGGLEAVVVNLMSQESSYSVSDDEKLWGLLAWLLSIVGAILALALKPNYRYAKYWSYLSISFFIIAIIASIIGGIVGLVPILGWILQVLISLGLLVIWIIGIIKALNIEWWKPQIIYELAKAIGIEKI